MSSSAADDYRDELIATANTISTPGKGILAADESTGTIGKRLASINVENTLENRVAYRELLFTTPSLGDYISGAITYEETLLGNASDGTPFVELLQKADVIPGIKTDKGVKIMAGTYDETTTQGIDDLEKRCQKYYDAGARFCKWRCVLKIDQDNGCPSQLAIDENAHILARYASISQANGLCPIIEPEILMDGNHSIQTSAKVTQRVLAATFKAAQDHFVLLEGALLKPNMVHPGKDHESFSSISAADVAKATLTVLGRTVPPALPGINFLSGGLSESNATKYLATMNAMDMKRPWAVSFSYGRALQASCLQAWKGQAENVEAAQAAFMARAKANGEATLGKFEEDVGEESEASLFESNYVY